MSILITASSFSILNYRTRGPLKTDFNLSYITHKNLVPTSQKTQSLTLTKNRLMSCREIMALWESCEKQNTLCWQNAQVLNLQQVVDALTSCMNLNVSMAATGNI
jgi:hypothetical protein